MTIIVILLIIISLGYIIKPSLVGYAIFEKQIVNTDETVITRSDDSEYLWVVQNPNDISSIKLSGSVSINGSARVYIKNDGQELLLFDSSEIEKPVILDNISFVDEASNEEVMVKLNYEGNSSYDQDNDGIETTEGIVDFTVKKTEFQREINYDKLCTKWAVESLDDEATTIACYGAEECCNFMGLEPERGIWNDTFYLNYGKYGAAYNNIVSAQLVYADYNLSLEDPRADVFYSELVNLSAIFYPEMISFEGVCAETCSISGFNSGLYELSIELDDAKLSIDSISYTTK